MSHSHSTFGPQVTTSDPTAAPPPALAPTPPPDLPVEAEPGEKQLPRRKPSAVSERNVLENIMGADQLTELQKATIIAEQRKRVRAPIGGTIPLICRGLDCKFLGYCSLHKVGALLPMDKPCPLETNLADQWRDEFLASIEFDEGSMHSAAVRSMVDELVGLIVVQSRIAQDTAKDPSIEKEMDIGTSFNGQPMKGSRLYPGFDLLLRIAEKRMKILAHLLSTPKSRAEAGRLAPVDPGTKAAAAAVAAAKIRNEMQKGTPQHKRLEIPIFLPEGS